MECSIIAEDSVYCAVVFILWACFFFVALVLNVRRIGACGLFASLCVSLIFSLLSLTFGLVMGLRTGAFRGLFSSLCVLMIFLLLLLLLMVLFWILLVLLNDSSDTVLLKPRVPLWCASRGMPVILGLQMTWGVVFLFRMGSFGVVLCPVIITLVLVVVPVVVRFMADISVKAAIASFNLLPVFKKGFAASDGFFKAAVNSSIAAVALSDEAVAGMVYFSGRNTTVSDTLVPLVFGI
jgi:hypothetical protein